MIQNSSHHQSSRKPEKASQMLFLSFIGYSMIIYLVLSFIFIPIFIRILQNSVVAEQIEEIGWKKYLLLGTQWSFLKNLQIDSESLGSTSQMVITEKAYKNIKIYSICAQFILFAGFLFIEIKTYQTTRKNKEDFIDNFSIEISNLPRIPPYIFVPILKALITVGSKKSMKITAVYMASLEEYRRKKYLQNKLEQETQEGQIEQLKEEVQKISKRINDVSWVVFSTIEEKQSFLATFQSQYYLSDRLLKIQKAPFPDQIIWENIHEPQCKMMLARILSFLFCICLLFFFDMVILFIQTTSYSFLTAIAIIFLEILLKNIIIFISGYERHKRKSDLELSVFRKLVKYLYINIGLLLFLGSYHYGLQNWWENFSTQQFSKGTSRWFEKTGLYITSTLIIQMIYVIFRPFLEHIKRKAFIFIKILLQNSKKSFFQIKRLTNQESKNQRIDLDICYSHFVSILMVGNTFSFSHPIFYPLAFIFCCICYLSHKKYVNITKQAPYHSDKLQTEAVRWIYLSIIMYFFIFYCLEKDSFCLLISFIGLCLLLFRIFFIDSLIKKVKHFFSFEKNSQNKPLKDKKIHESLRINRIKQALEQIILSKELFMELSESQQQKHQCWLQFHINNLRKEVEDLQTESQIKDEQIIKKGSQSYRLCLQ